MVNMCTHFMYEAKEIMLCWMAAVFCSNSYAIEQGTRFCEAPA